MANHFCALVLYDCACDVDYKSVINDHYYIFIVFILKKYSYKANN